MKNAYLEVVRKIRGWLSDAEAEHLYQLAADCSSDSCVVEIGSYRGRSTVALGLGSLAGNSAPVFAIEPHDFFISPKGKEFGPEDRKAFMRNLIGTDAYKVVHLINISSDVVCLGWKRPVGVLWIDGDHSYEGVLSDWNNWVSHVLPDGIVVFDDALDPTLGPARLIREIVSGNQGWVVTKRVGKTITIARS